METITGIMNPGVSPIVLLIPCKTPTKSGAKSSIQNAKPPIQATADKNILKRIGLQNIFAGIICLPS